MSVLITKGRGHSYIVKVICKSLVGCSLLSVVTLWKNNGFVFEGTTFDVNDLVFSDFVSCLALQKGRQLNTQLIVI